MVLISKIGTQATSITSLCLEGRVNKLSKIEIAVKVIRGVFSIKRSINCFFEKHYNQDFVPVIELEDF